MLYLNSHNLFPLDHSFLKRYKHAYKKKEKTKHDHRDQN